MAPFFQHGLAGLRRIREHGGVDVDHHLVALAGGAGIELVMQRGLGEQGERVGLLLRPGRGLHRGVGGREAALTDSSDPGPLVQRLAGRIERAEEQRARFGAQPAAKHHGAVVIPVDAQRAARVPARGLARFGPPVHAAPASHDALDVRRGTGTPDRQEARLGLRGRDAGQGADLGVGQLPARQGLGQGRQCPEGARYPHSLPGGARIEPHAPRQPCGAGAEPGVPATARVELPDEVEEAAGRRLEMGGELGDPVAQAIQLRGGLPRRLQRAGNVRRTRLHGESSLLPG